MSCILVHFPGSMYKSANIYRMANDTIVKFIELYRSYECLWNVSSKDYGSRLSRNAAYNTISRKMRIPGFGPREVARKIKNLRSAYQQEVKRIEYSEQNHGATGTVYRPRVIWFELLDDFLRNSEKSMQSDRQSDNQSVPASKVLSTEEKEKNNPTSDSSSYEFSSNEMESSPSSMRTRSSSIVPSLPYNQNRTGKRKKKEEETEEEEEEEEENANNAIELEEYKSFGKYVATSLSRMPFEYAVSAETEIHSVIIKYKVYAMRKIVYPRTTTTKIKTKRTRTSTSTSTRTRRHLPSTYLPPSNFSLTPRQRTEETRPSSVDSTGNAS